jgi:arylformamidase
MIDITAGLGPGLPVWPTSAGWSTTFTQDVRCGDAVTETYLRTDVHCGTHVDAPLHHLATGGAVEDLRLQAFLGPVLVVDGRGHQEIPRSVVDDLPREVERVLFRTDNSERRLMRQPDFAFDFVGISANAARALAERDALLLVGNDYLSVQPWQGDDVVHTALLSRDVVLLEGLDLTDVEPGWYDLVALPMLLHAAEAAPVRALLAPLTPRQPGTA